MFVAFEIKAGTIEAFDVPPSPACPNRLASTIEVHHEGDMILREALDMADVPGLRVQHTMGDYNVVGTCIIVGPYLADLSQSLCKKLAVRENYGESRIYFFVLAFVLFQYGCRTTDSLNVSPLSVEENLCSRTHPFVRGRPMGLK